MCSASPEMPRSPLAGAPASCPPKLGVLNVPAAPSSLIQRKGLSAIWPLKSGQHTERYEACHKAHSRKRWATPMHADKRRAQPRRLQPRLRRPSIHRPVAQSRPDACDPVSCPKHLLHWPVPALGLLEGGKKIGRAASVAPPCKACLQGSGTPARAFRKLRSTFHQRRVVHTQLFPWLTAQWDFPQKTVSSYWQQLG